MSALNCLKSHAGLGLILALYLSLALIHSLVAPLTVGNDEWAHFLYLRFIREYERLPATPAERAEAGYKADAPPLYHLLAAVATTGVESARLLRPVDSPRRQLADPVLGSYALVHTGVELPPYRGEVLWWHIGRGVSILWGAALLLVTYLTALELLADRGRALLATAVLAFIPTLIFHSSVLSYESLSAALTALFLWAGLRAIKQPRRWRWWLLLGGLAGLALTAKYSAVLLPLEIAFIAGLAGWFQGWNFSFFSSLRNSVSQRYWVSTRSVDTSHPHDGGNPINFSFFLIHFLTALAVLALVSSWWFGWLAWHFNTIKTQGPVVGMLQPLLVGDASDTTSVQVAGFLFGAQSVAAEQRTPLARNYGHLLWAMLESFWAAPVAGKFVGSPWLAGIFSLVAVVGLAGLGRLWLNSGTTERVWLTLLIFHTLLIVPLLLARIVFSFDPRETAQGRHLLLPAASAIAILLVWGWRQWRFDLGPVVVAGLCGWSLWGQVGWAAWVYPPPLPVWTKDVPAAQRPPEHPLNHTFAGKIRLMGSSWTPTDSSLAVTLWWQALETLPEDYLVELSLLDEAGRPVGYALGQPVQGRYPTRAWEPNDVIKDDYELPLVNLQPGNYRLQLRLLHLDAQPLPEADTLILSRIPLTTLPASPLDPCVVWFQGRPETTLLFSQSYPVRSTFTVISVDPPILATSAGAAQPVQKPLLSVGTFHVFMVQPDWAEHYRLQTGSTTCRDIWTAVPARNFSPPTPPHPLEVNFNNEVKLLGYDLPTRRIQPGQRLPLTLYWQALAYMGQDYRVFDNLLDSRQQRWGGYDRRPRDGYSTLLWVPGEVITDAFGVPVDAAAPNGIYTLDVGLYQQSGSSAVSLPLLEAGQPAGRTSLAFGPIKVGGPPPDAVTQNPQPQTSLNLTLGNQITLLGYDLKQESNNQLLITLYWRADTIPAADYTVFMHLRDSANQNAAQKDNPPAEGRYPTSLWDAGEVIVDTRVMPPANVSPGRYHVVVGLYNPVSEERLPVPGYPNNEISLEPIDLP
ncbi:MAG: glycosyltransferase family 39 protein [Anaerolineae bacterium]